jgi:anti-sigma factor RsiW
MAVTPTPELLSAYLDGELAPADREAVERALASDARLRRSLESLRTVTVAVGRAVLAEADRADFSGLADRVLARVPRSPTFLERLRSRWIPVGGLLVAAAAAAVFFLRPPPPEVGPVPSGVTVQSVTADGPAEVQPVVMKTETGDAIIWLVEHPDASSGHPPASLQTDKPGVQTPLPSQERPKKGEL